MKAFKTPFASKGVFLYHYFFIAYLNGITLYEETTSGWYIF
tara:strand:+ start:1044 stop:1166 length:123 start_codon:yes stop_codon:yes gene_type:complete